MKPLSILPLLPLFLAAHQGFGGTATRLTDFEGIEEPTTKYVVAKGRFEPDDYENITESGNHTVRMTLRYRKDWWDADRDKLSKDRQRAEVKGIGPHQKMGETFEYQTTWRSDPAFQGTDRFCHIFQLKATNGDDGPPLVVLSILPEAHTAAVRYCSGRRGGFKVARQFPWKQAEWQTVRIRIKTSQNNEGEVSASVNGDAFQGVKNVPIYRPDATEYRPKWGLYRGVHPGMAIGDSYIEHQNATAEKK